MGAESIVRDLLAGAGVQVGGTNPWDIRVHNPQFYELALGGSYNVAETYKKMWETEDLAEFINLILRANLPAFVRKSPEAIKLAIASRFMNLQSSVRALMVAKRHYDHPDQLYGAMLDPTRGYTCALWDEEISDLREAQERKYDRVLDLAGVEEGQKLLDIGFGWAGLIARAATERNVRPTGISVSKEQIAWSDIRYRDLPLTLRHLDYRKLDGRYDAIVSVEMIEAVGRKNLRSFFSSARRCQEKGGRFALQVIWAQKPSATVDAWINRFIFPNGELPTMARLSKAVEGLYDIVSVEQFGHHYDRTLREWNRNFQASRSALVAHPRLGERFCQRWEYYLLSCAGAFRAGDITVGHVLLKAR